MDAPGAMNREALATADRTVVSMRPDAFDRAFANVVHAVRLGKVDPDAPLVVAMAARRIRELARKCDSDHHLGRAAPETVLEHLLGDDDLVELLVADERVVLLFDGLLPGLPRSIVLRLRSEAGQLRRTRQRHDRAYVEAAVRLGADGRAVEEALRRQSIEDMRLPPQIQQRPVPDEDAAPAVPRKRGGRVVGARGHTVRRRQAAMFDAFLALPPDEQARLAFLDGTAKVFIEEHIRITGASRATAYRDWDDVLPLAKAEVGELTPLATAIKRGDKAAEQAQREALRVRRARRALDP